MASKQILIYLHTEHNLGWESRLFVFFLSTSRQIFR